MVEGRVLRPPAQDWVYSCFYSCGLIAPLPCVLKAGVCRIARPPCFPRVGEHREMNFPFPARIRSSGVYLVAFPNACLEMGRGKPD